MIGKRDKSVETTANSADSQIINHKQTTIKIAIKTSTE